MATKMKTIADPYFPDCELVPAKDNADKKWVNISQSVYDETYFRVIKKTQKLKCLVTIMADGYHVAWDTCNACIQHITVCKCKEGVTQPARVVYCHSKAMNEVHGEPKLTTKEIYEQAPAKTQEVVRKPIIRKPYKEPAGKIITNSRSTKAKGMSVKDIENTDSRHIDTTAKKIAEDRLQQLQTKTQAKGVKPKSGKKK